jgi:putative MATE family efflux protein
MEFKLFSDKAFYRSLFGLAIPIMLQSLVNSFVNVVDTVMIGRLGTVEIAAVGLGNQIFFLCNMVLFGINSGAGIFTAQFWGKRDISGIRYTMGLSLLLSACCGALFMLAAFLIPETLIGVYSRDQAVIRAGAAYLRQLAPAFIPFAISFTFIITLRGVEQVSLAMVSTFVSLSVNVVLNYLLIYGYGPFPAFGERGAAIGTLISRLAEAAILISVSYSRRYCLAGTLRELLGFSAPFVHRFLRITCPVILNELFWSLGVTSQNIIFARTGTEAIAAFNITGTVSQLTWVIFIGLGSSAGVLVGKKIGEGNEALARDYAARITRFSPLLAAFVALLLIPLSRVLPCIFNVNDQVLHTVSLMFIVLSCSYPFRGFNMAMIIGVCRAGGDTVFSVIYDIVFMAVSLPLAAVAGFVFKVPVVIVYLFVCSEEVMKVFLGLWRLKSGRWLHNCVRD